MLDFFFRFESKLTCVDILPIIFVCLESPTPTLVDAALRSLPNVLSIFVFFMPNQLGDSDNYVIRETLVTVRMNFWHKTIKLSGSP